MRSTTQRALTARLVNLFVAFTLLLPYLAAIPAPAFAAAPAALPQEGGYSSSAGQDPTPQDFLKVALSRQEGFDCGFRWLSRAVLWPVIETSGSLLNLRIGL